MSPVLDFFCIHFFRPQFYLTFWSLSMSDLQVPEDAYSQRVTTLEHEMKQIDDRKELVCSNKRKKFIYLYSLFFRQQQKNVKKKKKFISSSKNSTKNYSNKKNM
jgi:hypothetical protein